jgi:hypothetical protein
VGFVQFSSKLELEWWKGPSTGPTHRIQVQVQVQERSDITVKKKSDVRWVHKLVKAAQKDAIKNWNEWG